MRLTAPSSQPSPPIFPTDFPATAEEWQAFCATPSIAGMAGFEAKYVDGSKRISGITDAPARKIIRHYLEHIAWAHEHGKGLALCGGQGSGKTSVLALVAEAWGRKFGVRRHTDPAWRFSPEVPTMLYESGPAFALQHNMIPAESEREMKQAHLKRMCAVDLLLFDDLGSGDLSRNSGPALMTVFEYRITTGKVTCVTINGKLDDLKRVPMMERLPDKLLDVIVRPIPFPATSRREAVPWDEIGK
ncbi:MAG TPA: hypothetical protein VGL77_19830 [Armatimonadota bacterium]